MKEPNINHHFAAVASHTVTEHIQLDAQLKKHIEAENFSQAIDLALHIEQEFLATWKYLLYSLRRATVTTSTSYSERAGEGILEEADELERRLSEYAQKLQPLLPRLDRDESRKLEDVFGRAEEVFESVRQRIARR